MNPTDTKPTPAVDYRLAEYQESASELKQCPEDIGAEVAFAGRSNAGKSSAINALTDNKKLARTSKTPGRTQLINFFRLSDDCRLVDLPGYGYAKVPEAMKRKWQKHLTEYLWARKCLRGVVLLMDIRHPLQEFDQNMIAWCAEQAMPLHILLTKSDKLKRGRAQQTLFAVKKQIDGEHPDCTIQLFSSANKQGLDALRTKLDNWLAVEAEMPIDETISKSD